MFRVVWLETALNELADLWTKADSEQRRHITTAVRSIDRQLEVDPEQQGESRAKTTCVYSSSRRWVLSITFTHPSNSYASCTCGRSGRAANAARQNTRAARADSPPPKNPVLAVFPPAMDRACR
jgi:hypothetical protein